MRNFSSLSRELENMSSPIYAYVRENFPETAALARKYKETSSTLLVPNLEPVDSSRSSVIGDAFDLLVRFMANPKYYPVQALQPIIGENLKMHGEDAAYTMEELNLKPTDELPPVAAAVCWYLALTTQAFRSGISQNSPLAPYIEECSPEDLVFLAFETDREEILQLHAVAQRNLYPLFSEIDEQSIFLGPKFSGSKFCDADADLIVGRTLVELKTRLGRKDKNGQYQDVLRPEDARAILGYILFDLEDEYRLNRVALYSARYGTLFQIDIDEFLRTLAGKPVDLVEAREGMKAILLG